MLPTNVSRTLPTVLAMCQLRPANSAIQDLSDRCVFLSETLDSKTLAAFLMRLDVWLTREY